MTKEEFEQKKRELEDEYALSIAKFKVGEVVFLL